MKGKATTLLSLIVSALFLSEAFAQNLSRKDAPRANVHEQGIKLLAAKRFVEAARELESAIKLEPENSEARNALGVVYMNLNRRAEAAAMFREAIRLAPKFAKPYYNLGSLYERDGRIELAAEHYRRAVELKDDYAPAWHALGSSLLGLKSYAEAVTAFEKTARLDSRNGRVYVYVGYAYSMAGHKQKALESYRRAVRLNPDDAEARNNLAVTLYENKRFEESLAEYRKVIAQSPDYAAAHFNLGVLLVAMKNKTAALEQLKTLKRLNSTLETELFYLLQADKIVRAKSEQQ